jgi:APA family basic amino acid/polyamine antiporter
MTLGVPRQLYAFARDGFLPAPLAAVHPRWHTPHVSILVQALVTVAIALTGGFERLALVANGAALLAYMACCAAAWELRRRDVRQGGGVPFRVPLGGVVPVLAVLVIAALLTGLQSAEWKAMAILLLVAVPVYAVARMRRKP